MPKKKRELTLEQLARLTQEGFEAVDLKFEATDARFTRIESRMATKADLRESEERLLQAIAGIEVRRPELEALQNDVRDLTQRADSLEKKL